MKGDKGLPSISLVFHKRIIFFGSDVFVPGTRTSKLRIADWINWQPDDQSNINCRPICTSLISINIKKKFEAKIKSKLSNFYMKKLKFFFRVYENIIIIGDLSETHRRPRHASSETDMPDRRPIGDLEIINWSPTCLMGDPSKTNMSHR